jgi:hypothetical protein
MYAAERMKFPGIECDAAAARRANDQCRSKDEALRDPLAAHVSEKPCEMKDFRRNKCGTAGGNV